MSYDPTDLNFEDRFLSKLPPRHKRIAGVVPAIVTNNADPEGMGRVKLMFPWLSDSDESYWARVCQLMSGPSMGWWTLPEIDDEVMVIFDRGNIQFPYVIGSVWNGVDPNPGPGNPDGKNDSRWFQSRSGHQLMFDDGAEGSGVEGGADVARAGSGAGGGADVSGTGAGPGILLNEATGKNYMSVLAEGDRIEIVSVDGDISIGAPEGLISMEAMEIEVNVLETVAIQVANNYTETTGTSDSRNAIGSAAIKVGANLSETAGASISYAGGPKVQMAASQMSSTAGLFTTIVGISKVSLESATQKGISILLNLMGGMKSAITADKIALLDGTIFHSFKSGVQLDLKGLLIAIMGYAKTDFTSAAVTKVDGKITLLNP